MVLSEIAGQSEKVQEAVSSAFRPPVEPMDRLVGAIERLIVSHEASSERILGTLHELVVAQSSLSEGVQKLVHISEASAASEMDYSWLPFSSIVSRFIPKSGFDFASVTAAFVGGGLYVGSYMRRAYHTDKAASFPLGSLDRLRHRAFAQVTEDQLLFHPFTSNQLRFKATRGLAFPFLTLFSSAKSCT